MGSDAEIYVFDYYKFKKKVVPEFHKLLAGQTNSPWFESHYTKNLPEEWQKYIVDRKTNIRENCEILDKDFSYVGFYFADQVFDEDFSYKNYDRLYGSEARYCYSDSCPEAEFNCPFHKNQDQCGVLEPLHELFQVVIGNHCLSHSQFVGRTMNPFRFHDFFKQRDENETEDLKPFLYKLGSRGKLIGYGWANSDGIHGWLTPIETQEFVDVLSKIDLPSYNPTLKNLQKFMDAVHYINDINDFGYSERRPYPQTVKMVRATMWDDLALSFIRTMGIIALRKKQGLLWGNDIFFWW
ncbi:MAG: hypothetical protein ACFFDI_18660 [Promethearchaeota archaeon]